jgi:hypothetical protein
MDNVVPILNDRKSCASCRFKEMTHMQGQIQRVMVCHRFPPGMSMLPMNGPQGQGIAAQTHLPIVNPSLWCHEYQKQENPDATAIVQG